MLWPQVLQWPDDNDKEVPHTVTVHATDLAEAFSANHENDIPQLFSDLQEQLHDINPLLHEFE